MLPNIESVEFLMRGEALFYSSHIESMLCHIIIVAHGDNPDWEGIDIKGLQYKEKIKNAIESVHLIDESLYEHNKLLFEELNHLHFRHRMAHCPIIWDNKDKSFFTIWEFQTRDKDAGAQPVVYTLEQANQEIKRLSDIYEGIKKIFLTVINNFENKTGYKI